MHDLGRWDSLVPRPFLSLKKKKTRKNREEGSGQMAYSSAYNSQGWNAAVSVDEGKTLTISMC